MINDAWKRVPSWCWAQSSKLVGRSYAAFGEFDSRALPPDFAEWNCRPARRMTPWPLMAFNGVKVFSATMYQHRAALGDRVTEWIAANRHIRVVDSVVTQSSDSEFHCLSITLFYRE